ENQPATLRIHAGPRASTRDPGHPRGTPESRKASPADRYRSSDLGLFLQRVAVAAGGSQGLASVLSFVVDLDADEARDAGFTHGDAVEDVDALHRLTDVGDEDELGLPRHRANRLVVTRHIGLVERRVD